MRKEIQAEPYKHKEIKAKPYVNVQVAAEPYAHAPVAAPQAPALITTVSFSQLHTQKDIDQHSFGYRNVDAARIGSKNALVMTPNSYQFVENNGILQTVNYVADDDNEFSVAATNLPESHCCR